MSDNGADIIFSFVVDEDPVFDYMGWHLARSLIQHCGNDPLAVCVQFTPPVSAFRRSRFRSLGLRIYDLEPFANAPYCNKLNQLDNVADLSFDRLVLLDTDTIVVNDFRECLHPTAIQAKIVDYPRPPIGTLEEIATNIGRKITTGVCSVDGTDALTYSGNCNGGFYSIPRAHCESLLRLWREESASVLQDLRPLERVGHEMHVDQVGFWLALQRSGLPFELAPSNLNYFVHFTGEHRYFDEALPICILHYHRASLNVIGLLEPPAKLLPHEQSAVDKANEQIADGFDGNVFWQLRYTCFPERGSGLGSRGETLEYKRALLRRQGIEDADSVLDVGCGDLEVIKELRLRNYVGVDQSPAALYLAREKRPDWAFTLLNDGSQVDPADWVLCFEVSIHQKASAAYDWLLGLVTAKTKRTLIISGFDVAPAGLEHNPMLFFHEPLRASLDRIGQFRTIREIGRHTSVVIYRCDI